jgi:hydrogenase nickel incorporation protein HypA/HybF
MHELGITQNLVAIASDHAQGARVRRVSLEIGQITAIMPDAIRFCFDVCAQGTLLEGATLEILERPGMARCRVCGESFAIAYPFGVCECGSPHLEIIQGKELTIKELETEALCA